MNDTELEQLAARLGNRAVEALDAGRIADRVIARLDGSTAASSRATVIRWIGGLAAAAMVIVALGLALRPVGRPVDQSAMHPSVLQELDGLSVDQLEELLQTMPAASTLEEPVPLQDLDTLSLKRLLRTLEG